MKILIVDDNLAVREVLKEILTEADYEVDTAESSKAALEKIKRTMPNIVLLDADIDNDNGLKMLDSINSESIINRFGIIVLGSSEEHLPTDSPYLKGLLTKPFKGSDIIDAIEAAEATFETDEPREKPKKEPRKEKVDTTIFRTPSESRLYFGESYVFFQDSTRVIHGAVGAFAGEDYDVLLITSGKPKAIREKFRGIGNIDIRSLSSRSEGNYVDSYKLGSMIEVVSEFVATHEKPIIAFDNLNILIDKGNANSVLTMIYHVVKAKRDRKITVLVSVNVADFTEKDKSILTNCMTYYIPMEEKK